MPSRIDREARKAELAEAAWRVILRSGVSAVSVRTVAEEAGLAVGSLRHVFPTRTELLVYSAELMMERVYERIVSLPREGITEAYALAVIKNLVPFTEQTRAEMDVNIALVAEATAVPELKVLRDSAHEQLAAACIRLAALLREENSETPSEGAIRSGRRLHALADGLALHLMHRTESEDLERVAELLEDEIQSIAAGRA
ncbi:TetR/AcrR family transcriptional regulator [Kocuria atrinae]|uniref:HTH tetR-type domain-containing protein n=1 Tax=Kocuria atrinae TaxID=592377 RepID=A0ABN2Y7T6_9MICC